MDTNGLCYSKMSDQEKPYSTAKIFCENGNYVDAKLPDIQLNDEGKAFKTFNWSKYLEASLQESISFWIHPACMLHRKLPK